MKFETDEGTLTVEVGDKTAMLDVYEAYNTYVSLHDEHADDAVSLGAAWAAWLASKGLTCSHHVGFKVAEGLAAQVEELKKKPA